MDDQLILHSAVPPNLNIKISGGAGGDPRSTVDDLRVQVTDPTSGLNILVSLKTLHYNLIVLVILQISTLSNYFIYSLINLVPKSLIWLQQTKYKFD